MRVFIGKRLPFGVFAGISFHPHIHPRSVISRDGSATELREVPHTIVYAVTLAAGIATLWWLFNR